MNPSILPWQEVTPVPPLTGDVGEGLAWLDDTLRAAWQESIDASSAEAFQEARTRTLRRHAIETGIIERLYDVEWGVTERLVADGLTMEATSRGGELTLDTLDVIRSQFDALMCLAELVQGGRPLTLSFIKELHQAITRHQTTYEARNDLGQVLQMPLAHGTWKTHPNHVRRADGSLLQYVPPEHVQLQMERLIEFFSAAKGVHPIIRAAWLHHRFICIHPFADGNGRVARALVLLVLLEAHYAPIVVDRRQRDAYIAALDQANDGDLRPLVRLFTKLERVALRAEVSPVLPAVASANALDVFRTYADRLAVLGTHDSASRTQATNELAGRIHARLTLHLDGLAEIIRTTFAAVDANVRCRVDSATPPDPKARWWYRQLVRAARQVDFFSNLREGSWWVRLGLTVLGQRLRYVAAVQKVGHGERGVLELTAFAELLGEGVPESDEEPEPLFDLSPLESVTFVYNDDLNGRWPEVEEFINLTLSAAADGFGRTLG